MAGQRKLADEVRAGLDSTAIAELSTQDFPLGNKAGVQKHHFLDEALGKKTIRRHVLEFSWLFGILGLGVTGYSIFQGSVTAYTFLWGSASITFILLGFLAPILLWPLWKGWMGIAKAMNFIMTPVILTILWFCVLAPTALLLRIIGKKVMDLSFRADTDSYWIERPKDRHDFKRLERQF